MATRLAQKAYRALHLVEETSFKQRAKKLAEIDERGFALILYWNQIEAALKLARYGYCIEKGWPDELTFLGTTWAPLQRLKKDLREYYESVLGKSASSLRSRRNEIAHEGCNVSASEYGEYVKSATLAIMSLQKEVPKVEQLRKKKRRHDVS